jgi:HK97 family phage prohead protease
MRIYAPIAKVEAETHMVWGYASTEATDDQGEIVTRAALAGALGDYMKFANIREMHRMSAVGVAEEAAVDDKGLHVGARIVDPAAWEKVRQGVYKGFSIGGRVKSRDPGDRRVITGLALTEISLVDRPANPEAVFDCWKSDGGEETAEIDAAAAPGEVVAKAARDLAGAVERLERCLSLLTGGDLAKALAGELLPRLDALAKRVDEIAATPLPPLTLARGITAIAKHEDGGAAAAPDDVIAALARMSDEERTLALIKAAHANPVRPAGFSVR